MLLKVKERDIKWGKRVICTYMKYDNLWQAGKWTILNHTIDYKQMKPHMETSSINLLTILFYLYLLFFFVLLLLNHETPHNSSCFLLTLTKVRKDFYADFSVKIWKFLVVFSRGKSFLKKIWLSRRLFRS